MLAIMMRDTSLDYHMLTLTVQGLGNANGRIHASGSGRLQVSALMTRTCSDPERGLLTPLNATQHCCVAYLLLFENNFGTPIYVVFLACIFVELFLNKECTDLDDF